MKTFRFITNLILSSAFIFNLTSCLVFVSPDNGKHKGWFKNSNNPHHPNSTNPGNGNGKGNGKH